MKKSPAADDLQPEKINSKKFVIIRYGDTYRWEVRKTLSIKVIQKFPKLKKIFKIDLMSYKLVSFFGKYSQCEHHEVWTSNNTKQLNGNLRKSSTNKVGLSPSKKICVICLIERPLKMMRNALYFILKALLLSRYLSFCHDFLVM